MVGVRTGDNGISHEGHEKANYEPGVDIRAQVVVLGEGPRGTLVKQLDARLGLWEGKNPQVYAIGLKEIWDLPPGRVQPGEVIHTLGWPLDSSTFGGGFLYGMQNDQLIVGLVVGLDYRNPLLDPHPEFQRLKTHPDIAQILAGGKMAFYGAKALPEGGWWSMPRLYGDGFLIIGDSAGMLNSQRLKGIHLGMKSGMLAAETILEALKAGNAGGATAERLASYEEKVEASWIKEELWPVRNFHQAFDHGLVAGMAQAGVGLVTGGRGWGVLNRLETTPGHERMIPLEHARRPAPRSARAGQARRPAHLRQAGRRLQLRHGARRGPAGPPAGGGHRHLHLPVHRRVRQPLPALLPGRRLRDGAGARLPHGRAPADQRQQLRPLQDLRHHGPVRDHHLGAPGRGRRAELREDVGPLTLPSPDPSLPLTGRGKEKQEHSLVFSLLSR